jgi:hypothetical protein
MTRNPKTPPLPARRYKIGTKPISSVKLMGLLVSAAGRFASRVDDLAAVRSFLWPPSPLAAGGKGGAMSNTYCKHCASGKLGAYQIGPQQNQIAMEDVCLRYLRLTPRFSSALVSLFLLGLNAQQPLRGIGSTIPAAELAVLQGTGQSFIRCLTAARPRDVVSG